MTPPVCESGVPGPVNVFPATSHCEAFGYSGEGRPLLVHYCGNPQAELRIFILAGQHGDEPDAREAAAGFLDLFRSGSFRAPVHLAVVVDANPDGVAAMTRRNAADVDLNRDHLLLSAPETAAVHAFVGVWRPDLIVDVHTYRPWRRELLSYDFVFAQETMIDFPTNPAVRTAVGPALQRKALDFVAGEMKEANIRTDRYTLIRPGIVRHSTTEILDARNNLALRFEVPAVLIEGRRASPDDSHKYIHPRVALLRSIEAVIRWASENTATLRKRPGRSVREVAVRCRYAGSRESRFMEMQSASKGEISRVRIPGNYLPFVRATRSIPLPDSYAVPRNLAGVLEVLGKHRFSSGLAARSSAEAYRIHSLAPPREQDAPPLPVCMLEPVRVDLADYVVFPARQTGGNLLALLLEPESQFGPHRLPELAAAVIPEAVYPIVRVILA